MALAFSMCRTGCCGESSISRTALAWSGASSSRPAEVTPNREHLSYTPKHLADKILQSKSALEGERKQVTVLFADVKGSKRAEWCQRASDEGARRGHLREAWRLFQAMGAEGALRRMKRDFGDLVG